MKYLLMLVFTVCISTIVFAQSESEIFKETELGNKKLKSEEYKTQFAKANFSALWTHAKDDDVLGFIGDNYQRLYIKFLSVEKLSIDTSGLVYIVHGKSMVKDNLCCFNGRLTIQSIRQTKVTSKGCDDEYANKGLKGEFVIIGEYLFTEDTVQKYSGVFSGVFKTIFYLDKKSKPIYDQIDYCSDGYTNNQFVGTWKSFSTNIVKRCNWGDYRIPNSKDFDIGAGYLSPADKYLKYGWENHGTYAPTQWWK